jgi:hypothetical protein
LAAEGKNNTKTRLNAGFSLFASGNIMQKEAPVRIFFSWFL